MNSIDKLIKAFQQVKESMEKAIKPGPALDYSKINQKPDRVAQEAAAPTIDYGNNRMTSPKYTSATDKVNATRAKLDAESKETALETIRRRQQVNKNEPAPPPPPSSGPNLDPKGVASIANAFKSEKEPHKDDPHHEAKEKKIGQKIKADAQDLLDMHKSSNDMVKAHDNGQWYLDKNDVNIGPRTVNELTISEVQARRDEADRKSKI